MKTKINIPAAIIATTFGVVFFEAATNFYYQPSLYEIDTELSGLLTTDEAKARAAVGRLLLNPASAQFRDLRSVVADTAKFVCGDVKARDKEGNIAGFRAFVYTVAIDFARIDDDGRIAQRHSAFKPCPAVEQDKLIPHELALPPGAQAMVKAVQKAVPSIDRTSKAASGAVSSGTMEQQLTQLGNRADASIGAVAPRVSGLAGGTASSGESGTTTESRKDSATKAAPGDETTWRSDRPPGEWPTFPAGHPLTKALPRWSATVALAMAKDIEDRWEQSRAGNAAVRPSPEEIREASRALLAINPASAEFPKAWAAFIRLRKIDRAAAA